MQKYAVEGHKDSLLPDNKNWKLVWNDEFDGDTLDETKWDFRLHLFHKPHPAYTTKGISFDGNSNLIMSVFEENGQFYSPQLQTGENFLDRPNTDSEWPVAKFKEPKFLHNYGYYEARVKLQKQKGWWSAFWVQSPTIGCSPNPETAGVELDIMECFTPGIIAPHTIHWGGYGPDHDNIDTNHEKIIPPEHDIILEESEDGFHTFGMHWEKDGYTFYIDGKQSGKKIPGPVSPVEQFILLTTECDGYRYTGDATEDLKNITLPDQFVVDYVRVFDEV